FKDTKGNYVFGIAENIGEDDRLLVERQLEQENRRLLYVAITRAVYKCYITRYTYYSSNTSLVPFVDAIKQAPPTEFINFSSAPEIGKGYRYSKSKESLAESPVIADNFRLK